MTGSINKHFKNEAILMTFPVVLILLALLAGFFGPKIMKFFEVDKCLDAGGAYNDRENKCETAQGKQDETFEVHKQK